MNGKLMNEQPTQTFIRFITLGGYNLIKKYSKKDKIQVFLGMHLRNLFLRAKNDKHFRGRLNSSLQLRILCHMFH